MPKRSNRILFFGNERLATGLGTNAPVFRALIEDGYDVVGLVVTQVNLAKSRKARELEIVQIAEEHDIPVFRPPQLGEAVDELKNFNAEAAVLVAYGKLIPNEIIELFPKGIINIHPSLLPKHRGPTPIEGVMLAGDHKTGVSLMKLAAEMDAGPVFAQEEISLDCSETKKELANQLHNLGKDMLLKHLPAILDGSLQPKEQGDDNEATYNHLIKKEDGELDPEKPAMQLVREVRAYAYWPRSYTSIGTTRVIVTIAHSEDLAGVPGTLLIEKSRLGLHTSRGTLIIDSLIPIGKKEMPASAFLAGYNPTG
jgi:methionyl-tRNA formyltransferase